MIAEVFTKRPRVFSRIYVTERPPRWLPLTPHPSHMVSEPFSMLLTPQPPKKDKPFTLSPEQVQVPIYQTNNSTNPFLQYKCPTIPLIPAALNNY